MLIFWQGLLFKENNWKNHQFPNGKLKNRRKLQADSKKKVYIVQSILNEKLFLEWWLGSIYCWRAQSVHRNSLFWFRCWFIQSRNRVSILQRIRSEQKFESVDLLKEQLEKDKKLHSCTWINTIFLITYYYFFCKFESNILFVITICNF
jgi:hypothetical protein